MGDYNKGFELLAEAEKRIAQLERTNAALRQEITVADLKRRGVQGLCALATVRAVNEILTARAAIAEAESQETRKENGK